MMLSASHPYPANTTRTHSSAIFSRSHTLSTERTSSSSASQHTPLPPTSNVLFPQRPRGSTLPSYSSGSSSVVYTSIAPERPTDDYEEPPPSRKERAFTLGSRSSQFQHQNYTGGDHDDRAKVALPPIRVSDHEGDAHDHDERSKIQDDPSVNNRTYNFGNNVPRLPPIRTMLETRMLPTPDHMRSGDSRTPPPRSPTSPQQRARDYHSRGSVISSSWNGYNVGAGNVGNFHHPSPSPDDSSHAYRQASHNGGGEMQTPMSSSSSVSSSLSSQPVSLPPSSPQRNSKYRGSLASAGASILSLTAPFRHKKHQVPGAASPPVHQYEPSPRGSFDDSEYSSTTRSTPRHVSEELSSSIGRGSFGAQPIPSGVHQSLASSQGNMSNSVGSFPVTSESDGGGSMSLSIRSRVGETAGGKKRRSRATQEQLEILNGVYQRTPFPTTVERSDLALRLGMTPRSVQIWFQNKRQGAKHNETRKREHPTPLSAIPQGSPPIPNLVPLSMTGPSLPLAAGEPYRSSPSPLPPMMDLEPPRVQLPTHRSISHGSSLTPNSVDTLEGRSRRRGMSVNDLLSQERHPHLSPSQARNGAGYEANHDDKMEI